ncbi:hypothetical protein LS68_001830 [Helicobacter sp. MIT 05-5293]|uniref:hypothetical protein n=1 Tax=Helicobacter sp. MIT 05-5293 TaxID=1548149 RepID=UPI00051D5D55|nr:hypothetical protein [Helicobacter sp. MIT 05-5293]TLD81786.1 hypothetical protein LS68_001830 [Helicobacter sp. MIT 05-5293]
MRQMMILLFFCVMSCVKVFAYVCNHSGYCEDGRIGIGAHYSNLASPISKASSTGGYISMYGGYYYKRLYGALDFIGGLTRPRFKTDSGIYRDNASYFFASSALHLGASFGKDNAFLLYLVPRLEVYSFGEDDRLGKFAVAHFAIGPHIRNRFSLSEKLILEAELGAEANSRRYIGESFSDKKGFDGSYRLNASLGLYFKRGGEYSRKIDFYTKLGGVFYHNKAYVHSTSVLQPTTRDFALMLEVGMTLENLFRL